MAIARDATSQGNVNPGTSLTVSHVCTGSNLLLLVHVLTNNTNEAIITGVTYNGVSMTKIKTQVSETTLRYGYIYGLLAPSTGANNVVVSASSSSVIGAQCVSYTGVKQSGLPDASNSNNTAGDSWTESITTIADNCWHFLARRSDAQMTITGGGSKLLEQFGSGLQATFDSNSAITPAGNHSITGTTTQSTQEYSINISFAPAVAASHKLLTLGVG